MKGPGRPDPKPDGNASAGWRPFAWFKGLKPGAQAVVVAAIISLAGSLCSTPLWTSLISNRPEQVVTVATLAPPMGAPTPEASSSAMPSVSPTASPTKTPTNTVSASPTKSKTPDEPIRIDPGPQSLGSSARVSGSGKIPEGFQLWVMVRTESGTRYWISGGTAGPNGASNRWQTPECVVFGNPGVDPDSHGTFHVYAVLVPAGQTSKLTSQSTYSDGYVTLIPSEWTTTSRDWVRNEDTTGC